jgi:hypothetical protein
LGTRILAAAVLTVDSSAWILESVLIVVGLSIFEVVNSVDNAVINSEVLSTMSAKSRKWFLTWGIIIAVFLVRGLLPILILWSSNPNLSLLEIITAMGSPNPALVEAIETSAPVLLIGGGTFLVFLFFFWLFLEPKQYGLKGEAVIQKHGVWFYAAASILLAIIVWFSIRTNPAMAFGAVVGSTGFFITHGFKENATQIENRVLNGSTDMSAISKLLYLEVIDTTFSIDGVLGAFAFTLAVPLILIGNGIGAIVVRQLTLSNIEKVKKYKYLKNGAMYAVFALGMIMILDSFNAHIPTWFSPLVTFLIIGYFLYKSKRANARAQNTQTK